MRESTVSNYYDLANNKWGTGYAVSGGNEKADVEISNYKP